MAHFTSIKEIGLVHCCCRFVRDTSFFCARSGKEWGRGMAVLLVLWVGVPWRVVAQQASLPVHVLPASAEGSGEPQVWLLKNFGHRLSRQQAWDLYESDAFRPRHEVPMPGKFAIGKYTFWAVFVLENRSADTLDVLVHTNSPHDTLWRWHCDAFGPPVTTPGWFPAPLERQVLPYRAVKELALLRLLPFERDTFLSHIKHTKPHTTLVQRLLLPAVFESQRVANTHLSNLFFTIFFGVIGVIFLFAVAQYWQQRDLTFFWYAFYLGALMLGTWRNIEDNDPQMYSTFYLAPWTWTKVWLTAAYFCGYTLFVYYFLRQTQANLRLVRGVARFVVAVSAVACSLEVVFLLQGLYHESWLLYYGYRVLLTGVSLVFLWPLWRGGVTLARIIFFGTLCAILGELVSLFATGNWSSIAGGMGILLDTIFLAFGLAYRSRLFVEAHTHLQNQHIRQLEENAHLREIARREEVEAFKNRFYANITHEFRTPLTVILGVAESLRHTPDSASRSAGAMVERNSQNLLRLVNQLLDLSKIESGGLQLRPVQADVVQFVRTVVEMFESLAASHQQHLHFESSTPVFNTVFDPDHLQQVLANLIGNAQKFTPDGGQILVSLTVLTEQRCLQIAVQDTGVGIDSEGLAHIFDRFYQGAPAVGGAEGGGVGIGLALVKELLELMHGHIEVESTPGQGSTFLVTLPVDDTALPAAVEADWNPTAALPLAPETTEPQADRPTLLLVEDNADLVAYLTNLLEPHYQLLTARNGQIGLEQALEHLPDVILSDVMMPQMDGFEFCQILKSTPLTSHIPIVMLTARATVADKIGGLQRGADAWLTKPFDRSELLATLASLLDSRQRLRAYFENLYQNGHEPSPDLAPLVQNEHAFLTQARACVDAHLSDETYDVSRFCHDLAVSRMQLHRKLTALGAPSAALFIRAHRLAHAQTLLKTTDLTVAEVAFRTGFSDPAYFTRCFREQLGKSPSEWRKQ